REEALWRRRQLVGHYPEERRSGNLVSTHRWQCLSGEGLSPRRLAYDPHRLACFRKPPRDDMGIGRHWWRTNRYPEARRRLHFVEGCASARPEARSARRMDQAGTAL